MIFCPNFAPGELAERSIAAVLKTVEVLKPPGVRIPNSPLLLLNTCFSAGPKNESLAIWQFRFE